MAKKNSKAFFKFFTTAKEGLARWAASVAWVRVAKTFGIICVFVGICVGFWWLDRYRRDVQPTEEAMGPLKLVQPPAWLNEDLKIEIRKTAMPDGIAPNLDEKSATIVAQRLSVLAWLADVKVETTPKGILISAEYREPVAMVEMPASTGLTKYYLTRDMIVLDYLPMARLPIVQITGVQASVPPTVGQKWDREDAAAAVEIIDKLRSMDRNIVKQGDPPLLPEIKSIDVTNFDGRRDVKNAHIVLKATDGKEILWGAKLGVASRYMEANDYEKLTMLYEFYLEPKKSKAKPTLLGRDTKYVELRIPRDTIPRPTVPPDALN
jgi:hypothetical protein